MTSIIAALLIGISPTIAIVDLGGGGGSNSNGNGAGSYWDASDPKPCYIMGPGC